MKKTVFQFLRITILFVFLASLNSCEKDNPVQTMPISIEIQLPESHSDLSSDGISISINNLNTGAQDSYTTNNDGKVSTTLEKGMYTFNATATKIFNTEVNGVPAQMEVQLNGILENVLVSNETSVISINLLASTINPDGGWIIKEIFAAGGKTIDGNKAYNWAQFIEIYNNSNVTLYADGLSIAETQLNGAASTNGIYSTEELAAHVFVRTIYTIPGNGTTYPVAPGKGILIAPQPINHNTATPLLDLSSADFQWYDYTSAAGQSIDVPEVPNLIKYYSYSATIWLLTIQGNAAYVLFRVPDISEDFVTENTDIREMGHNPNNTTTSIRIMNEYVLDAVESKGSTFNGKMLSPAVDAGYIDCVPSGTAKSIRRNVKEVKDGRVIYQDTNNSSIDFMTNAEPQPKIYQ